MLDDLLIGGALVAVCVIIHAIGTTFLVVTFAVRYLKEDGTWGGGKMFGALLGTVIFLGSLHLLQVVLWALTYRQLVPDVLPTFEEALYFSSVTFTTLGYGDITLTEGWRVLSGIEAVSGILLVGWSTALMFAVVQRSWTGLDFADKIRQRNLTTNKDES